MQEKLEASLRDLISSLQLAKIYPLDHPSFRDSLDKAWNGLLYLLSQDDELVIGIVGDELAFGKEIFFELSKMVKPLIQYLKERDIERIVFRRGIKKEELAGFINFLITPKEKIGNDVQKYLSLAGVENISAGKIKVSHPKEEDKIRESVSYLSRYEDSLNKISKSIDAVLNNETLDYLDLKYTVTNVMENLVSGYQEFLKLAALKKHDIGTFVHLLDVAILSMFLSYKMGFGRNDILDIGVAALFHDIGKIYISHKVMEKPDKLSEEEFLLMKSHTTLGAQILLKYTPSLGILPAVVAFEHHLRYDLKGYPKLTFAQKPHTASLIVSLCDVYDALQGRRAYKKSYPPELIYNLMLVEKGRLFEPELLESFFKLVGVWPVGTIVALTDSRIAVVREENEDDIFSPKVEVISADGKEYIDLKEEKGKIKIEHTLDPLNEGKGYSNLV